MLPHIILKRARLKVVDLSGANLSQAQLQQAVLNVSRLSGANLSQAQLQQAQLNVTNLIQAVLVGANLHQASLIRAELLRADLSNTTLIQANLQEADLREARLRWARLNKTNLSQCNLRNSNLSGSDLTAAQLYSANMESANLKGAILRRAEMRHANLHSANLNGANLREVNLRWADLSGANLEEADLTGAKLSGANLAGARLGGAILKDTILVHADFSRANLQGVYCVSSDLSGATLTGALLHGATCNDLKTAEIDCKWIDLSPHGDRSEVRQFSSAEDIRQFFNRQMPKVQLVVDQALDQPTHTVLATVYNRIGQQIPLFSTPPDIEITYRRTLLTFSVEALANLLAIAYLVVWPFSDYRRVWAALTKISAQSPEDQETAILKPALNAVKQQLGETSSRSLPAASAEHPFFAAPIQVTLSNTIGQTLELYHSPQFGIRNLSMQNAPSADRMLISMPSLEAYVAFVAASNG